jgi:acetyltransferase
MPEPLEELSELAGAEVTLRPIRADDLDMHDAFIASLDPQDLRFRFGGGIRDMQSSELDRVANVDHERETIIVATMQRDGGPCEIIGEVRAREDAHGERAEFAIVVRSDLQKRGLGRLLLDKVIRFCRSRGVRMLYGLVAPSNVAMLALARRLGFDVDHVPGGTTAVVTLEL